MEKACIVANEAILFLIRSIPKDAEGDKGEMRASLCEAQDWIHTLYAELKEARAKAMETLGVKRADSPCPCGDCEEEEEVKETPKKVSFSDKIELVSEEAPRNEVIWNTVEVAEGKSDD
jgi:hypothetical protein